MEFAIGRTSAKGQLVIPNHLRDGIEPGDEFLIVRDGNRFIVDGERRRRSTDDLAFAEAVDKAWNEYEEGRFRTRKRQGFVKELRKAWPSIFLAHLAKCVRRSLMMRAGHDPSFPKAIGRMRHERAREELP